jgi:hypothetical protein
MSGGTFQGLGFDQAKLDVVDLQGTRLEIALPSTLGGATISVDQAVEMSPEMAKELGILVSY